MDVFPGAVIGATFLCSLVAGFLFAFAVVAMPGIGTLEDGDFIRAFQVMDRVIQNNQPVFMLVWVGSAVLLLLAFGLGVGRLDGVDRILLVASTLVYFAGVQLPTIAINIPLNNMVQSLDVARADEAELKAARDSFEPRWNRSNVVRTVLSSLTAILLMTLLVRL